jgi:hypothetical protein
LNHHLCGEGGKGVRSSSLPGCGCGGPLRSAREKEENNACGIGTEAPPSPPQHLHHTPPPRSPVTRLTQPHVFPLLCRYCGVVCWVGAVRWWGSDGWGPRRIVLSPPSILRADSLQRNRWAGEPRVGWMHFVPPWVEGSCFLVRSCGMCMSCEG